MQKHTKIVEEGGRCTNMSTAKVVACLDLRENKYLQRKQHSMQKQREKMKKARGKMRFCVNEIKITHRSWH